jgi:hypothetical protein
MTVNANGRFQTKAADGSRTTIASDSINTRVSPIAISGASVVWRDT